jgi:hypothetical protein
MPRRVDLDTLKQMLVDRIEEWLPHVLDDVRMEGNDLRGLASDGTVIKVCVRGPKRGTVLDTSEIWSRRPGRRGGSLLNLLIAEAGGSMSEGRREAEALLGLTNADVIPRSPAEREERRRSAQEAAHRRQAEAANLAQRNRALAQREYAQAEPVSGSPAEAYLDGRGVPAAPMLKFAFVQRRGSDALRGLVAPALLAPIRDTRSDEHVATQYIYITERDGGWRKSLDSPAKIVLGRYTGGVIVLSQGALAAKNVLVAEGIEDALTASLLLPHHGVLAAICADNLAAVALPPHARVVVLVRQRDGANAGVRRTRETAIRRWLDEGRRVEVLDPPRGAKDINEAWQTALARAAHCSGDAP